MTQQSTLTGKHLQIRKTQWSLSQWECSNPAYLALRIRNRVKKQVRRPVYIYRTFHPKAAKYTFFSSAYGPFYRIDNILGHISSLSKFKTIEITSSIFSDHNAMRLETNYRGKNKNKNCKRHKHMEPKNMLLNDY